MPIRIRPDQNQGNYSPRSGGGGRGGSGGGGGIGNLIPILIGLFGRNPKLLLIVAVIGAIFYFMGGKGCVSGVTEQGNLNEAVSGLFSTGANFDLKKYSATEIFEPLSDNKKSPLPERVSLEKYAPDRLNQGQQGSCVAWASAYAARSIMETRANGQNPNSNTFSPAFLYNQIALENCQGSYLKNAMEVMQNKGLAPYREMPYNENDCSAKPNTMAMRKAEDFKITGFNRLTGGRNGEDPRSVNMLAIKQNIAQGSPVVIGMMVGGTFMQDMMGKDTWQSTDVDRQMSGFGGHAMCIIGYDDYKFARNMGGFQIMNSWGKEWGNNGIAWVSYDDFEFFGKEAYGIYPMGDASAPAGSTLQAQLGVVMNKDGKNLSLEQTGSNSFRIASKMPVNEDFKLEIINNIACYVYVFGMETDGSSYVLFPYTEKHSPFCGITGRRLFPRDFSLYADDKGNADFFAFVITKDPIDYEAMNTKLSAAQGSNYVEKLNSVIGSKGTVRMQGGMQVQIETDFRNTNMLGVVIEVQK
jgi:C1A family cysteine protease